MPLATGSLLSCCRGPLHGKLWCNSQELVSLRNRTGRSDVRAKAETTEPAEVVTEDDQVADALKQAKELMNEVQSQVKDPTASRKRKGGVSKVVTATRPADVPRVTLQCDVNGCTIVPVTEDDTQPSSIPGTLLGSLQEDTEDADVFVLQGKGWKLGVDRRPVPTSPGTSYHGFVGGDDWSISLTHEEYDDFVKLLKNLRQGVATLEVCGDWGEEGSEAQLEMSTSRIWMQGRATQKRLALLSRLWSRKSLDVEDLPQIAFSLRFMIRSSGRREAEGSWSADAVMQVLKAIDKTPSSIAQDPRTSDTILTNPAV